MADGGRHVPVHLRPWLVLVVFLGGMVGATARHVLTEAIGSGTWPTATLGINLTGSFLLGVLLETLVRRGPDERGRRLARLCFGTGVLGAYTTYSTFAVETTLLVHEGHQGEAVLYALVSLIGGLAASALGVLLAHAWAPPRDAERQAVSDEAEELS